MDKALQAMIPKLVAGEVLRTLENNLVAKKICTLKPKAPIKKYGDTVYFTGLADPTVKDYEGSIEYEKLKDGSVALLIDQQKYVAFQVEDIEEFQSQIEVKGSQTQRSIYSLRNVADQFILGQVKDELDNIEVVNAGEITSANTLSPMATIIQKLEENNVMENMRWGVITPWFKQKMILAGIKFQINNGMEGQKGGISYADYQDTECMVSNNVATITEGENTDHLMPFGSYNSLVFADQINKTKLIDLEGAFAHGHAFLYVYGAKIVKPKEIKILRAREGAETTI